jgi:hypothetical protein
MVLDRTQRCFDPDMTDGARSRSGLEEIRERELGLFLTMSDENYKQRRTRNCQNSNLHV